MPLVGAAASRPGRGELDQTRAEVERPQSGHGAPDVLAARPPVDCGKGFEERVAVPEGRPRDDDEEEADLEEVRREEQTPEQISLRCLSGRA
jgi:hypothetical protein